MSNSINQTLLQLILQLKTNPVKALKELFKEKPWLLWLLIIIAFSFLLDMFALSQYSISYGPDGPYYDIQVRHILRTGFPDSNDAPLVYYYLVPFVLLIGDSYIGVKIGMALIGSLMTIPAFLLTESFTKKTEIESKVPALLTAFLITINVYYFRMIEDFMQNLAGVFFLLWFFYFSVKLYENIDDWKKNGILTMVFFILTILTHIYPAGIAIVLFGSLFVFGIIIKTIKTNSFPKQELKIIGMLSVSTVIILIPLFILFPSILTNFSKIESFWSSLFSTSLTSSKAAQLIPPEGPRPGLFIVLDIFIYLTIPTLVGIVAILSHLYQGVINRSKEDGAPLTSKKTFLAWVYFVLIGLLFGLSLPFIPENWRMRFILLAFLPIALIVPIGLKFIELVIHKKYPTKKQMRQLVILAIAIIFALSAFLNVVIKIPSMGPVITMEQYDELVLIKNEIIPNNIDLNGIIYTRGTVGFPYWVEYVLDMDVEGGNLNEVAETYLGRPIYGISQIKNVETPFRGTFKYPWNPFLPLGDQSNSPLSSLYVRNQAKSTKMHPSELQEISGLVIFRGECLELSLLFDENGTSYLGSRYLQIANLGILLDNPLSYDERKVSIDLEITEKVNNRVFRAMDNSTTEFVVIASPNEEIPVKIGDLVQVNGTSRMMFLIQKKILPNCGK